jgi:hypothetical protein
MESLEWTERMTRALQIVHQVISPDEQLRIRIEVGSEIPLSYSFSPDRSWEGFTINPVRLMSELQQMIKGGLDPENVDDYLFALASHELRHMVIYRGLASCFSSETIDQLRNLLGPAELTEYYINAFHCFLEATGNAEEADAHLIEIMVFHALPYLQEISELRNFIFLSPQKEES